MAGEPLRGPPGPALRRGPHGGVPAGGHGGLPGAGDRARAPSRGDPRAAGPGGGVPVPRAGARPAHAGAVPGGTPGRGVAHVPGDAQVPAGADRPRTRPGAAAAPRPDPPGRVRAHAASRPPAGRRPGRPVPATSAGPAVRGQERGDRGAGRGDAAGPRGGGAGHDGRERPGRRREDRAGAAVGAQPDRLVPRRPALRRHGGKRRGNGTRAGRGRRPVPAGPRRARPGHPP